MTQASEYKREKCRLANFIVAYKTYRDCLGVLS